MKKQKQILRMACALACIAMASSLTAAERQLDYAVEDAAYETIKQLTKADLPVRSIAFLGLFGERHDLAEAFRAGLIQVPGVYEFYTRNEAEWNKLVSEIEFGVRKEDIMDPTTIQSFGDVKGVEALLYGSIMEAGVEGSNAIVRLAMTLARVTTGQLLWSANIEGRYEVRPPPGRPGKTVYNAALQAGQKAAEALKAAKGKLGNCNVYCLPLRGEGADIIFDIVMGELIKASDKQLRFFFKPAAADADARMMRRIAEDLTGTAADPELAEFRRINQQLQQLFGIEDEAGPPVPDAPEKPLAPQYVNAALMGSVTGMEGDATKGRVALNLNVLDITTNEVLCAANVEGVDVVPVLEKWGDDVDKTARRITVKHIAVGIVVVLVFLVLVVFMRGMRRAR